MCQLGYSVFLFQSELAEPASPHSLLHRFSESSIDLHDYNSIASSTESSLPVSLTAKTRRILFRSSHQDIPSIHLTRDEDRPFSPTSLSLTSSSGNFMRLETLQVRSVYSFLKERSQFCAMAVGCYWIFMISSKKIKTPNKIFLCLFYINML